jgi:hypothetical protein
MIRMAKETQGAAFAGMITVAGGTQAAAADTGEMIHAAIGTAIAAQAGIAGIGLPKIPGTTAAAAMKGPLKIQAATEAAAMTGITATGRIQAAVLL